MPALSQEPSTVGADRQEGLSSDPGAGCDRIPVVATLVVLAAIAKAIARYV